VVEVEAAVEAQRLDDEPVTLRIGALQRQHAARVLPKGRDDDGQVDAGVGGDGLQLALVRADDARLRDHEHAQRAGGGGGWLTHDSRFQ
jgi:hypothetical protein